MSPLLEHARHELATAADSDDLAVEQPIAQGIQQIVRGFAEQGHSGGSASIVGPRIGWIVGRLLAHEPITPLTGAPDEWTDVTEQEPSMGETAVILQQNRRCSRVFRERTARPGNGGGVWVAWALDEVVWTDRPFGAGKPGAFTAWDSARRIRFPWQPGQPRYAWKGRRPLVTAWARLRGQLRP
jgi:hypothetical protein